MDVHVAAGSPAGGVACGSGMAALLYMLFTPFRACCECTGEITEFLYMGILLPLNVAKFVVDARNCEGL